jgi:hypothetical protein
MVSYLDVVVGFACTNCPVGEMGILKGQGSIPHRKPSDSDDVRCHSHHWAMGAEG